MVLPTEPTRLKTIMKIFAISDTHFNHKMLVEKGYRPADYEEQILSNLQKVGGDLLILCGDFTLGNSTMDIVATVAYIEAARNFKKKILVRGNHDHRSDSWYMEHGFDLVCESFVNTYFGKKIIFTHIPVRKTEAFDFNIHGHLHGKTHRQDDMDAALYDPAWHKDLAPEIHNYGPVNLEKLI